MRDALYTPRTWRYVIGTLLVGRTVRTAAAAAGVAAAVANGALAAVDGTMFGLFDSNAFDNDCSIAQGTAVLTSPNNPWSAGDVGKAIDVQGAGVAGATLRTAIIGFTDAGSVTLATNASTGVAASSSSVGGLAIWGNLLKLKRKVPASQTEDGSVESSAVVAGVTTVMSTSDFSAAADGVTDDSAAIASAIAACPDGGTVLITGICRIASPLVITTRVSLRCPSAHDAILADVGVGNDAITYQGTATGINGLRLELNVYGRANACRNAVVLSRVDRSRLRVNVHAGAVNYGLVLDGCLIDRLSYDCSTNYAPPITAPALPAKGLLIQRNVTYMVATNAGQFDVNIEGVAGDGVVATAQVSEGGNRLTGTIEGVGGKPLNLTTQYNLVVDNLWMEANGDVALFTDIHNGRVGPGVFMFSGAVAQQLSFVNCQGVVVDGVDRSLVNFDAACALCTVRQATTVSSFGDVTGDGYCNSSETIGPIVPVGTTTQAEGGHGMATLENLFHNPFMDVWSAGGLAAPDGASLTSATVAKNNTHPYPGANGLQADVTITAATVASGMHFVLKAPYQQQPGDRWIAVMIPVYVATGQPDAYVYLNGNLIGLVTARDQWVVVRGACAFPANTAFDLYVNHRAAGNWATGSHSIGGLTVVNGARCPKFLGDHGKRASCIAGDVTIAPSFVGQLAFVTATTKWYLAKGVAAGADWVLLN